MSQHVDPGSDLLALLPELALPSTASRIELPLPEGLTFSEWEQIGDTLACIEDTVRWWIGDWWSYGKHRYGERARVADFASTSVPTLYARHRGTSITVNPAHDTKSDMRAPVRKRVKVTAKIPAADAPAPSA